MFSPLSLTPSNSPILVYTKSYFAGCFHKLFQSLNTHFIDDFSDHACPNRVNLPSYDSLVRDFRRGLIPVHYSTFSSSTMDSIVSSCRLLRNIDSHKAYSLAIEAVSVWDFILSNHIYKACFTQLVDDYIAHSLSLACSLHDIPHLTFMNSYITGFTEVCSNYTGLSVLAPLNKPTQGEIVALTNRLLKRGHVQTYGHRSINYSRIKHIVMVLKYLIKFALLKFFDQLKIRSNTFYTDVQPYLPQPTLFSRFITSSSYVSLDNLNFNVNARCKIYNPIFIPLGVYPEASSDYWLSDFSIDDSLNHLSSIISQYPHLLFIIKDHFHMNGIRCPSTIYELIKFQNVLFVDPSIPSTVILDTIRPILLCGGGSPGFEALLRNLHVFTWCDNSPWYSRFSGYSNCHYTANSITPFDHYENILDRRNQLLSNSTNATAFAMIECNLATTLPFDYISAPIPISTESVNSLIYYYKRNNS